MSGVGYQHVGSMIVVTRGVCQLYMLIPEIYNNEKIPWCGCATSEDIDTAPNSSPQLSLAHRAHSCSHYAAVAPCTDTGSKRWRKIEEVGVYS